MAVKIYSLPDSDKLLNKLNLLNEQVKSPVNISEVTKAIYYARKYHGSQMRKSGELYYSHPIEVGYLFAEHIAIKQPQYFKTDLIITALLHDTIEDTELTKDMIKKYLMSKLLIRYMISQGLKKMVVKLVQQN